jgi:plastocyanin
MRLRPSWLVTAALAAAACGSGGGGNNVSGPQITIVDFQFSPQTVTVKAGTTVTWVNEGPSVHQSTSDNMPAAWASGDLGAPSGSADPYGGGMVRAGRFQFTFTTPGTYSYHCGNHPPSMPAFAGFTGTIVVIP